MQPAPIQPVPLDRLIGNDTEFPVLRHWRYFNHAGVAPLPRAVGDAIRRYTAEAESGAYLGTTGRVDWYATLEKLRWSIARLINADAAEIALLKNTSEGLATVATGLRWRPGDVIITTAAEYPSNFYPWQEAARRFGAHLLVVPEVPRDDGAAVIDESRLLSALDGDRVRMLAVSHVQFGSGYRLDLARLGRACRQRGVLFCVDGIQTVGVLPVDVQKMSIDFLAADGHKWLFGPEGAGFLYVRKELLPTLEVPQVGWNSVKSALEFDPTRFELKASAGRFESGTMAIPGFVGLEAGVAMVEAVGVQAITERVRALTARLASGARDAGWTVASARDAQAWSGIVALTRAGTDLPAFSNHLRTRHRIETVVRGVRKGDAKAGWLRASPAFYNTDAEVDLLLAALADTAA